MVQSQVGSVDEWMVLLEPERRDAFETLRRLCRERLHGWHERMQWGMPGYGPAGADPVVSFNSQKQHIAVYIGPTAIERFAERLGTVDRGKGCLRYRRARDMDFAVIGDMLDDVRMRNESMC